MSHSVALLLSLGIPTGVGLLCWMIGKADRKIATRDAELEGLRVHIAVQRYKLERGVLPDSLDQVVPEFLPEVPVGPYTGQPLGYSTDGTGYVVYSFGPDGDDDNGAQRLDLDTNEGDIITWPAGKTYAPRTTTQPAPTSTP